MSLTVHRIGPAVPAAVLTSRTTGLLGFTEVGWESPYGVITVVSEVVTVVVCVAWAFQRTVGAKEDYPGKDTVVDEIGDGIFRSST